MAGVIAWLHFKSGQTAGRQSIAFIDIPNYQHPELRLPYLSGSQNRFLPEFPEVSRLAHACRDG
jgi:hypothetical protein